MLRIEFQIPLTGISLQIFDDFDSIENIEIDNALPIAGDKIFLFLTAQFDSGVSSESLGRQLPDVQMVDVTQAKVTRYTYYLRVIADFSDVSFLTLLTEHQAVPHRIVGRNAHLNVVASVRDWNHLKEVAGAIEDEHGSLELIGTTQTESVGFPLGNDKIKQSVSGKLSDKQLEVLEAAYQMGYFKVPQEVTAEELADELDISRSTLSERLRRVEHNFCGLLFGPQK